jgi:hypothetical protein
MLIKRLYKIEPLACPECGGPMKVVAFLEPPQGDVIEKSCGRRAISYQSANVSIVTVQESADRPVDEGRAGDEQAACPADRLDGLGRIANNGS